MRKKSRKKLFLLIKISNLFNFIFLICYELNVILFKKFVLLINDTKLFVFKLIFDCFADYVHSS